MSTLGHAQRRAIRARTMKRAEWLRLTQLLRKGARNPYAAGDRPRRLSAELARMTGCEVGYDGPFSDELEARMWLSGAWVANEKGRDAAMGEEAGPRNCLDFPGFLRIAFIRDVLSRPMGKGVLA